MNYEDYIMEKLKKTYLAKFRDFIRNPSDKVVSKVGLYNTFHKSLPTITVGIEDVWNDLTPEEQEKALYHRDKLR